MPDAPLKVVLNVGCGKDSRRSLPPWFRTPEWREVRLDIDPAARPDIVASSTDMRGAVDDASMDAVWCSHNLHQLYAHEVELALSEFARVLKPKGVAIVVVPDLQKLGELLAQDKIEDAVYTSPLGPIAPLDMLYGHRRAIAGGNLFMAHKTGFTANSLRQALARSGMPFVDIQRRGWDLLAMGAKEDIGTIVVGSTGIGAAP